MGAPGLKFSDPAHKMRVQTPRDSQNFFHQCDCSERFWFIKAVHIRRRRQAACWIGEVVSWLTTKCKSCRSDELLCRNHTPEISHGGTASRKAWKAEGDKKAHPSGCTRNARWSLSKSSFPDLQLEEHFTCDACDELFVFRHSFGEPSPLSMRHMKGGSGTWIVSREQQYGSLNSTVPSLSTGDIAYKLVHCSLQEGVPCLFWGSSMSVPKLWVDPIKLATRLLKRHRCSRRFSMPVYRAWACLSPLSTEKWNCSVRQL